MINNKLLLTMLLSVLGLLLLSPLQAMERNGDHEEKKPLNKKELIEYYRTQRKDYDKPDQLLLALFYAIQVIDWNPDTCTDNEHATIEDFRCARDINYRLGELSGEKKYFEEAFSYGEGVVRRKRITMEDYQTQITLCKKIGDFEKAAYYEDLVRNPLDDLMNLILRKNQLSWNGQFFPCSWGHGGIKLDKKEGDGATPVGNFPFRRVFYRADRLEKPETTLPLQALMTKDGWCDDVNDPSYNQHVALPYGGRHEKLWREDHVYDLILVVGHNDDPVELGKGSAIFVHLRRPEGTPTEGCVALELQDLLKVLKESTRTSSLVVTAD